MPDDARTVLLAGKNRNTEAAMPAVEEFFRSLALRVRARMVNRSSSEFLVRLASVSVADIDTIKEDTRFRGTGVFGLLQFNGPLNPGLAVLQRPLLTRIIGAMLGDDEEGEASEDTEARPLSPVESRIAQRIFTDLCRDIAESWPLGAVPDVRLDGAPGSGRVAEKHGGEEASYVATLEFGPEDVPYGLLSLSVPTQVLRGLAQAGKVSAPPVRRGGRFDFGRVLPIEVEVVAEVARLPMRVKDLRGLEVGDVVPLGPVRDALVRVNGRPLLSVEPGHANGQRSVRVLGKVR